MMPPREQILSYAISDGGRQPDHPLPSRPVGQDISYG